MARTLIRSLLLALSALVLQGCISSTPRFDRAFGMAVRSNTAAQVLNPAAAANTNPAAGIDGASARSAQERYRRSFAQPEPAQAAPLIGSGLGK